MVGSRMDDPGMSGLPPFPPGMAEELQALATQLEAGRVGNRPATIEARRRKLLEAHCSGIPVPDGVLTCIGDSHTVFFAGAERLGFLRHRRMGWFRANWINRGLDLLPCFRTFHLGPATAWKCAEPGSSTMTREKLDRVLSKDLPRGSRVLLSFGEIDCRVHMSKRVMAGEDVGRVARETAGRFMRLPLHVRDRGFQPVVWGPAQTIPNDEWVVISFPVVGDWQLRRAVTHAYNKALREMCVDEAIPFVVIEEGYEMGEGTDPECFIDGIHLSQRLMPLALKVLHDAGVWEGKSGA
jgi:hypothetical protein